MSEAYVSIKSRSGKNGGEMKRLTIDEDFDTYR